MRTLALLIGILIALVCCSVARSQVSAETIETFVSKLGSDRFAERDASTAALDKLG